MRTLSFGFSLICLAVLSQSCSLAVIAADGEDLSKSWWVPKHLDKANESSAKRCSGSSQETNAANASDANPSSELSAGQITGSYQKREGGQEGTFVVPNWFASQPKPYTRPTEIFRANPRLNPYGAPLAGGLLGGIGSGFGWGALGGGFSPVRPGWGWGGGINRGGWGGGFGGWGGGLGGWGGGLGGWGGGLGGWGGGWGGWSGIGSPFSPGLGSFRSTGQFATSVIQTEPSKASGNYYEPSTVDTTASGSYYASGAPALVPSMPINKTPDTYWNDNSNPVPKELR